MSTAAEVGSGQVPIFPTFRGFRRNVLAEVSGAEAEGSRRFQRGFARSSDVAGQVAGKTFSTSFRTATTGVTDSLQKEFAQASRALSTARLQEADAAGKVRVAEASLAEARSKGSAESARVIAAEERLAASQRRLVATQSTVGAASLRLVTAKRALASATEDAARSTGGFFSALRNSNGFDVVTTGASNLAHNLTGLVGSALSAVVRGFATFAAIGVGAVTTVGAAVAGLVIGGGITRALNIEDAQAKLRGLGNSTEDIASIMNSALASVKGTAFSLGDAATVAASAVAAGVKPGEQLTRYLKLTADAATIAGVSLGEMGSIINKTTTSGKVFTDNLNELADRGIPIFTWLQDEYKVSAKGLSDMVTQGKVDAATFQKVIEAHIGGAALASGATTRGAYANMLAAMSRTGERLVSSVLPRFREFFNRVSGFFDSLAPQASRLGELIGAGVDKALGTLERVLSVISDIAASEQGFTFSNIRRSFEQAIPGTKGLFDFAEALAPLLPTLAKSLTALGPVLLDAVTRLTPLVNRLLPIVVDLLDRLIPLAVDTLKNLLPLIEFVVASFTVVTDFLSGKSLDFIGAKAFRKGYGEWYQAIYEFSEGAANAIRAAIAGIFNADSWANGWAQLTGAFAHGWEQIAGAFANGWQQIIDAFSNGYEQIQTGVGTFLSGLGAFFADGWAQIQSATFGFLVGLTLSLANGWNQIVAGVSGAVGSVVGSFSNGWNQIVSGAQGVIGFLSGMPGQIISFFSGAGGWLYSAGQDIIRGLVNGIGSMVGAVANAARDAAASALNAAKSFLGIQSPSRVFRLEVGRQVAAGMALGIGDGQSTVTAAAQRLSDIHPALHTATTIATASAPVGPWSTSTPVVMDGDLVGNLIETFDGRARTVARLEINAHDQRQKQAIRAGRR